MEVKEKAKPWVTKEGKQKPNMEEKSTVSGEREQNERLGDVSRPR